MRAEVDCGLKAEAGQSASSGQPPLLQVSQSPWMVKRSDAEEQASGSAERLKSQKEGDQDLCDRPFSSRWGPG